MNELRRSDEEARALAVREFERPVVLEAGAGTGKTRALVARLATWLLGPGWEQATAELAAARSAGKRVETGAEAIAATAAEGVVAITFTDAAAAEMSVRLGRLLADLAAARAAPDLAPLPPVLEPTEVAPRATALASALGRLRIQTIHAFCHRLLCEHPFEAGLHPTPSIDADGELLTKAATEALKSRLRQRSEPLVDLIAKGVDPLAILETLTGVYAAGATPADLGVPRFDGSVAAAVAERLADALDAVLPRLRSLETAIGRRVKTLAPALEQLEALREAVETRNGFGLDRLDTLSESARESSEAVDKVLARWRAGALNKTETEALGPEAAALFDDAARLRDALDEVRALRPFLFESARDALHPLLEETRARLRREGVLTFEDLLARAVELLERNRNLLGRLRRGIRQLLVDEFQDTDARQCRLIELLVLEPGPSPPGLFLVGDPKQSIYAFRSADLASYEELLAKLDTAAGIRAPLAVNFRSAPPLLEEVERVVAPAMHQEPGVQPAFVPLLCSPERRGQAGFTRAGRRPVEYWISWQADGDDHGLTAAQAAELEATAIARDVRELHDGEGCRWNAFALLLRARGDLESYLDALRDAGIPFEVQKDRSYFQRREVIDLACAVRAILDPGDLLALVAFLRSPLVGVPDAAWIPLWSAGFAAAVAELDGPEPEALRRVGAIVEQVATQVLRAAPGAEALEGWPVALIEAVEAIADLRAAFARLSAAEWIERLRLLLLPEPIAAARYLGRFGLANVQRLLDAVETALTEAVEPSRALSVLRRAIAERREAEEARPPGGERDAVSVLTIHTAKGLEFDHVYLPQIHKQPRREQAVPPHDVLPSRSGEPRGRRELVLLGAPSPGWWAASVQRRRAREAETVRLLYVALTRARERFVVCGAWPRSPRATDRPRSLLDLLGNRRVAELEPAGLAEGFVDAAGALWRLCSRPASPPPVAAAIAPEPPQGETSVEPPTRRIARREAARARQRRPRTAAATDSAWAEPPSVDRAADESAAGRARALGSALHRALERLDPGTLELDRALAEADPGPIGDPLRDALRRFRRGALGARFRALAGHLAGRELPLLLAADPNATDGPLSAHVGTLDLLYRDPADGRLVVVDFKSDAASEESLAVKIDRYSPQLRIYGDAVRRALGADRAPRLELWFLALDRIVEIPARDDAGGESG